MSETRISNHQTPKNTQGYQQKQRTQSPVSIQILRGSSRQLSPSTKIEIISPLRERPHSPVRVTDTNLSYEDVIERVFEGKYRKSRAELQRLEDELDQDDDDPKILMLKRRIRTLEVQNRLNLKENKENSKLLIQERSKNIVLDSELQLLRKRLDEEQNEKVIMEQILMQKIAELQIDNQQMLQQIQEYEQDIDNKQDYQNFSQSKKMPYHHQTTSRTNYDDNTQDISYSKMQTTSQKESGNCSPFQQGNKSANFLQVEDQEQNQY